MNHVETQISELHSSEKGVHVGTVAVNQPSGLVNDAADLDDVGVKQAQGAGQGDHYPGQVRTGDLA